MMPWSVAKGVASTALLIVAAREGLDFDAPVAKIWPEFALYGGCKDQMTVADATGYRGGMTEHPPLHSQALHALLRGWRGHWEFGIDHIQKYEPEWPPGERASYHPMSYSWIVGGIVERVDSRRRHIADVVAEEIAKPLDCEREMYLGRVPQTARDRLVRQCAQVPACAPLDEADRLQSAMDASVMAHVANSAWWGRVCLPSSNGFFSAVALAKMYALYTAGGACAERQILPRSAVDDMVHRISNCRLVPASTSRYATKGSSGYRDSLGFHPYAHEEPELYGANCASAIGCAGAGGSVAFADPVSGLSGESLASVYVAILQPFALCELFLAPAQDSERPCAEE